MRLHGVSSSHRVPGYSPRNERAERNFGTNPVAESSVLSPVSKTVTRHWPPLLAASVISSYFRRWIHSLWCNARLYVYSLCVTSFTHLVLGPRLRMIGAIPLLHHTCHPGLNKYIFTFAFYIILYLVRRDRGVFYGYEYEEEFLRHLVPWVDSAFTRAERRPVRRADILTTFICRLSWNSGYFKLLVPSGPVQACTGIALAFHFFP
jgi:hypothetical protein